MFVCVGYLKTINYIELFFFLYQLIRMRNFFGDYCMSQVRVWLDKLDIGNVIPVVVIIL